MIENTLHTKSVSSFSLKLFILIGQSSAAFSTLQDVFAFLRCAANGLHDYSDFRIQLIDTKSPDFQNMVEELVQVASCLIEEAYALLVAGRLGFLAKPEGK